MAPIFSMAQPQYLLPEQSKPQAALERIQNHPEDYFGTKNIDARDRALLDAAPAPFVDYQQGSYLRKIVSS